MKQVTAKKQKTMAFNAIVDQRIRLQDGAHRAVHGTYYLSPVFPTAHEAAMHAVDVINAAYARNKNVPIEELD